MVGIKETAGNIGLAQCGDSCKFNCPKNLAATAFPFHKFFLS
jgi:hypothetical protein